MLKAGRKIVSDKLTLIVESGGWMVLRSPKNCGAKYYISRIKEFRNEKPDTKIYPAYYEEFIDELYVDEQWFYIDMIKELDEKYVSQLIMNKTDKMVEDVISTTRTAVMFIKSEVDIQV